jgi:hypothetical protein
MDAHNENVEGRGVTSRYQTVLDPRVEKFVIDILKLPRWDSEEFTRGTPMHVWIFEEISHLNDAMKRTVKRLEIIQTAVTKQQVADIEGYWPTQLLGGGTWFTEDVKRYDEAVREVTEHRDILVRLVTSARGAGLLAIPEATND